MNESNNNQNDQPTEEQKPSGENKVEYRELSDEEKKILEDHKKWLESDGKEGKQADLQKANLQNTYLLEANLQNATLGRANLQEAYLEGANLQAYLRGANLQMAYLGRANLRQAYLRGANLQQAYLRGANLQLACLRGANLQQADFGGANLQQADFGGANLQQANLERANLQKAILSEANLQQANLTYANLQKVELRDANLQEASLRGGVNLQNANLNKADMRNTNLDNVKGLNEANLKYANMEGSKGLLGNEFAQADVTGTKLPDDIKDFKALEIVKETSQNARKIFFAMLLGCVYSWLTIATTTDVRLLTNSASSPLPIIGTEIPIAWFYIAAPLVLICLYFYFNLYLDNLWKNLASLPAIFADGKPLDQTAYPWLLNSLVCRHFEKLRKRHWITHLKEWITIFLAWWVVPITMVGFWSRYLVRHEFIGTTMHIGLLIFSITSSLIFHNLCKLVLQGNVIKIYKLKDFWYDRKSDIVIIIGFILILISNYGFTNWGANFREKDISMKPNDYYRIEPAKKQIESVKGADLKGRNLNNADMSNAFLVKADLRQADLQYADLGLANLQNADLWWADLQNADLGRANLKNAELLGADLRNANLFNSNLQNAFLLKADLRNANLAFADLGDAILEKANLQEAELRGADFEGAWLMKANLKGAKHLSVEKLSKAKNLFETKLDSECMKKVKECCPELLIKQEVKPYFVEEEILTIFTIPKSR